jgi:hypothetical protein
VGNIGGAAPAPPCPLCAGTGQRRIRRPGTPRKATVLVACRCAMTKSVDCPNDWHDRWHDLDYDPCPRCGSASATRAFAPNQQACTYDNCDQWHDR